MSDDNLNNNDRCVSDDNIDNTDSLDDKCDDYDDVELIIYVAMSCSIELKRLEQELFNHCKISETDPKANSGILLRVS